MQPLDRLEALVEIMDRLRDPGGCPWDREQDFESLRRYLLEECYEVAEALDQGAGPALREELGDLLFQIVFLSRLAQEEGAFAISDVIRGIAEKLIRRHPHVFGDETVGSAAEVESNWERIKREERAGDPARPSSALDGIPAALPALLKARLLGERAAKVGFDWKRPADVLDKIDEELAELRAAVAAGERGDVREEAGDLLFTTVMLARKLNVDPEGALAGANAKFLRRFTWLEQELCRRATPVRAAGDALLEQLWDEAKTATEP